MIRYSASPDDRDNDATDRDDAADRRDINAADRDSAALTRDVQAADRDDQAVLIAQELRDRFDQTRKQIVDRLARLENMSVEPADWHDLTPAALARLRAHAAEQRQLAALDRAAIGDLLDDLRIQAGVSISDRLASSRDRHDARQDRRAAARDRIDAGCDRDDSDADRAQAAIERQQADPADTVDSVPVLQGASDGSLTDQAAQVLATSRRRIEDSRAYLAPDHDHTRPAAPTTGDAVSERPDNSDQQSRNTATAPAADMIHDGDGDGDGDGNETGIGGEVVTSE